LDCTPFDLDQRQTGDLAEELTITRFPGYSKRSKVMAKTLEQLHTDHINASKLLNILEQQFDLLAAGQEADIGLMIDIMTYMTQYPDLYHHPKEDLIFEQWQKRDASVGPLVEEIGVEHKSIIRSSIHALELLRGVMIDVLQRRDEILAAGRSYITRQREHMNKEEGELFPRMMTTLRSEDWQWIDELMAAQEDPLFGRVVSKQFRKRYDQIMRLVREQ
jgi:hemerythrin-like domain-containing protein